MVRPTRQGSWVAAGNLDVGQSSVSYFSGRLGSHNPLGCPNGSVRGRGPLLRVLQEAQPCDRQGGLDFLESGSGQNLGIVEGTVRSVGGCPQPWHWVSGRPGCRKVGRVGGVKSPTGWSGAQGVPAGGKEGPRPTFSSSRRIARVRRKQKKVEKRLLNGWVGEKGPCGPCGCSGWGDEGLERSEHCSCCCVGLERVKQAGELGEFGNINDQRDGQVEMVHLLSTQEKLEGKV